MEIKEIFESQLPREFAGDNVFRRYRFQIFFAADLLLKLLTSKNENSTILLDYFDDVVYLDDCSYPTKIKFYQVKTSNKLLITMTEIIHKDFLKKMAWNLSHFKDCDVESILATNGTISFNFKNAKGDLKIKNFVDFSFNENKQVSISTIISKSGNEEEIKSILEKYIDPGCSLDDFYLMRTDFALENFETVFLGKLTNYLSKTGKVVDVIAIKAINNCIIETLSQKQAPGKDFDKSNFNEIIENKGITAKDFKNIISSISASSIPNSFVTISTFASAQLKFAFSEDLITQPQKYSAFKNAYISSEAIVEEVFSFLKGIDISKTTTEELFALFKNALLGNSELYSKQFVKDYTDFIVVVFIYKLMEGNL